MVVLRNNFLAAFGETFFYKPQDPPDLLAFLEGLWPTFLELAASVEYSINHHKFPGASQAVAVYWYRLCGGYTTTARSSFDVADAYRISAAAELARFYTPRENEHLTNVGRSAH